MGCPPADLRILARFLLLSPLCPFLLVVPTLPEQSDAKEADGRRDEDHKPAVGTAQAVPLDPQGVVRGMARRPASAAVAMRP